MNTLINQNGKIQIITPKCYNQYADETLTGLWNNCMMIREVDDMIKTTNRLELWEWIRDQNPPEGEGYMFWNHENVNAISIISANTSSFNIRCLLIIILFNKYSIE